MNYCRFHRNYGHTTEGCWALKDHIEELIQAGYLARFVRRSQEEEQAAQPRQGGSFQSKRRRRYRPQGQRNQEERQNEVTTLVETETQDQDHDPQ